MPESDIESVADEWHGSPFEGAVQVLQEAEEERLAAEAREAEAEVPS